MSLVLNNGHSAPRPVREVDPAWLALKGANGFTYIRRDCIFGVAPGPQLGTAVLMLQGGAGIGFQMTLDDLAAAVGVLTPVPLAK